MNNLPNFLIVGASKSGTSSLYHYLNQHPEIFLSEKQKEGRFFSQMTGNYQGPGDLRIDDSISRSLDDYKNLFSSVSNEKAIGDISPEYLYFYNNCIPLIKKHLPEEVKIIIILRSPVERAFSGYLHFKRDKRETLSFEEALTKEEERADKNWIWAWQYKNSGLYYEQVKAYVDYFRNVKIIVFDEFRKDEKKVLNEICSFIGVNPDFNFDTSYKYNVSGDPKNEMLYKLETSRGLIEFVKKIVPDKLVKLVRNRITGEKQMVKPTINEETRLELINFFRADILKLQDLIQKDLSHWMR